MALLSPQQQKRAFLYAFKGESMPTGVEDIMVMPDYSKWLDGCTTNISRYCKMQWTQLQWVFTAVDPLPQFPFGVKTQYRRYSSDEAFDVVDKQALNLYSHIQTETRFLPLRVNVQLEPVEGFHILTALPTGPVPPMPLSSERTVRVEGACGEVANVTKKANPATDILGTIGKVRKVFSDQKDVIDDWDEFYKTFPKSNDVKLYVKEHGMHIPFFDLLSGKQTHYRSISRPTNGVGIVQENAAATSAQLFVPDGMLTANALPSVIVGTQSAKASSVLPYQLLPHPALVDTNLRDARQIAQSDGEIPLERYTTTALRTLLKQMGVTSGLQKLKKNELLALARKNRSQLQQKQPNGGDSDTNDNIEENGSPEKRQRTGGID